MTTTSILRGLAAAALCAAALAAVPATARAEGCDETPKDDTKGKKNFHVEIRNGQKVYVIDKEITVCGKVPRPSVVYVLQPRTINYQWETLKQDFLPQILESVKKEPF
jgi:hypothetical protein